MEAVSNTFIIFTSIPWGFYDATSLKHNMFQTGGWFFKPTNWEMVRLEILYVRVHRDSVFHGNLCFNRLGSGPPRAEQPEKLNKIDVKIQLEGDLQMIDFNDFDHGWQKKFD